VLEQPVVVEVRLSRGRVEQFQGKIEYVSQIVDVGGNYTVWAEVENRMDKGHWLLRPGLKADMEIRVGAAAAKVAQAERN
jgi:hypothetical protein